MQKAENKIGKVKKSKYPQQKRHRSQMNEWALNTLVDKFNKLDKSKTTIHGHLLGKKTITFSKEDIDKILNKNNIKDLIIEYNRTLTDKNKNWDERIVIRDNKISQTDKGKQNLCIVLSLSKNEVITAYYNPLDDNHATINMDRYDKFPINGI